MNKLVYLHELDSVCNTYKEIEIGQNALFEEIVNNGNKVVITFNQLTDSEVFLSLIKNKDTYEHIMNLFKLGFIKVSRFGNKRTASQYVQEAIDKFKKENNCFIFSGLPINSCDDKDANLLSEIKMALKYSDPSIIYEKLKELEKNKDDYEYKRVEYIGRFVDMILLLSREELSKNPPKNTNKNKLYLLSFIYDIIRRFKDEINTENFLRLNFYNYINDSLDLLEFILIKKTSLDLNNRSVWIREICDLYDSNPKKDKNIYYLSQCIVNLVYNYVVEDSINNVSTHYDKENIIDEFIYRLEKNWNSYLDGNHKYELEIDAVKNCNLNNGQFINYTEQKNLYNLPDWEYAYRILNRVSKRKGIYKNNEENINRYENNYLIERNTWKRKVKSIIFLDIFIILAYFILFYLFQLGMNYFKDYIFELYDNINLNFINKVVTFSNNFDTDSISNIIDIVIFGIISSFVASRTKIPDILDILKNFFIDIKDLFKFYKLKNKHSYVNYNEEIYHD